MLQRRRIGAARLRMLLTAAALAAGVAGAASATHVLDAPEHAALDHLFQARHASPPSDVAIVAVDDVTFNDLQRPWPFRRTVFAAAVDKLHAAGAKEIVLDVQFTEPTTQHDDMALYRSIERAGGAVLATSESDGDGNTRVLGGDANLEAIGARAAAANLPDESEGGVIRRFTASVAGLPSLAAVVAERAGRPVDQRQFGPHGALIDFRGTPGTIPAVSLSRLLSGKADLSQLRGRVVVIGATAPTLHDQHATPEGNVLMSGPEVQANAIWTALHGLPLSTSPWWLDGLAILLGALAVPLLALRVRAVLAALAAPMMGLGYVAVAQVAFAHGVVPPMAGPLAALALASVATVAVSHMLETVERQRMAEVNDLLEEQVQERTADLRATELEIVQRLAGAVESRDEETGDHIARIAELCRRLALAAGLPTERADLIARASALHDVGKIAIPDSILRKPGPLTDAERSIMQTHTTIGGDMLAGSRSPLVQLGETIARTHHEHWDGGGYPAAISGEDIPLEGRICAVCDVFDALVSSRPYKEPWPIELALAEIRDARGTQFDPRLVDLFLALPGAELRALAAAVERPAVPTPVA